MEQLGRALAFVGLGLFALGAMVWLLGRAGFRGLPGDIRHESDHVRVYFPVVTSLALSALLTVALWAWRWIGRK